jgi:diadenosine tetraphosphatase ApaH/serine/threonine PP2A family protein phosphatase
MAAFDKLYITPENKCSYQDFLKTAPRKLKKYLKANSFENHLGGYTIYWNNRSRPGLLYKACAYQPLLEQLFEIIDGRENLNKIQYKDPVDAVYSDTELALRGITYDPKIKAWVETDKGKTYRLADKKWKLIRFINTNWNYYCWYHFNHHTQEDSK